MPRRMSDVFETMSSVGRALGIRGFMPGLVMRSAARSLADPMEPGLLTSRQAQQLDPRPRAGTRRRNRVGRW
jgi:hypothetical protein